MSQGPDEPEAENMDKREVGKPVLNRDKITEHLTGRLALLAQGKKDGLKHEEILAQNALKVTMAELPYQVALEAAGLATDKIHRMDDQYKLNEHASKLYPYYSPADPKKPLPFKEMVAQHVENNYAGREEEFIAALGKNIKTLPSPEDAARFAGHNKPIAETDVKIQEAKTEFTLHSTLKPGDSLAEIAARAVYATAGKTGVELERVKRQYIGLIKLEREAMLEREIPSRPTTPLTPVRGASPEASSPTPITNQLDAIVTEMHRPRAGGRGLQMPAKPLKITRLGQGPK